MLVLTRRTGEVVTIGDDIEVVVIDIKGKQIRLGIKAPEELKVHRKEVYERLKELEHNQQVEEA
jgi:carbon storage regulator